MGNKLSKFLTLVKTIIPIKSFLRLMYSRKDIFYKNTECTILILYQSKFLTLAKERVYCTEIDVNLKMIYFNKYMVYSIELCFLVFIEPSMFILHHKVLYIACMLIFLLNHPGVQAFSQYTKFIAKCSGITCLWNNILSTLIPKCRVRDISDFLYCPFESPANIHTW